MNIKKYILTLKFLFWMTYYNYKDKFTEKLKKKEKKDGGLK